MAETVVTLQPLSKYHAEKGLGNELYSSIFKQKLSKAVVKEGGRCDGCDPDSCDRLCGKLWSECSFLDCLTKEAK